MSKTAPRFGFDPTRQAWAWSGRLGFPPGALLVIGLLLVEALCVSAQSVLITEFMASNTGGLRDEDGDSPDWIELFNSGTDPVDLNGWYLTDNAGNPTKWRFPSTNLPPNGFLVVFASGKDRAITGSPLHTSFSLSAAGEYLALVRPDGMIAAEFFPNYPPQTNDISYGYVVSALTVQTNQGLYLVPTPGAPNAQVFNGFADAPTFSARGGILTNSIRLDLATTTSNGIVQYTVNGLEPTITSTVFTNSLLITNSIEIRARTFAPGRLPSAPVAERYTILHPELIHFSSDLPVLVLETFGRPISQGGTKAQGHLTVFRSLAGRATLLDEPDLRVRVGVEVVGQTSAGFEKQPYSMETRDEDENNLNVSLLGLPAESDWRLVSPYSDKGLMNDYLAHELWEQMGHYAAKRRFVEVFVNSAGGLLTSNEYRGVYVLFERIEISPNGLNLARLGPTDLAEPAVTGGYIIKRDNDSAGDLNFSAGGQLLKLHDPKPDSIRLEQDRTTWWPGRGYTPGGSNQMTYLVNYINAFSAAINASNWVTRTGTNHYSHYIDMDSFVDLHWIVEFTKNIEGYRLNQFMHKDRGSKLKMGPIWDWNLSFGNADYLQGGYTNTWYYTQLGESDHIWLRRLLGGAPLPNSGGDPDFIQKVIDRWGVLRTNILNGERLVARIDELASALTESAGRNYARYRILNTYVWPNPDGPPDHVNYLQPTYGLLILEMKKWTMGRYLWIDSQFPKAPKLGIPEGDVAAGSSLEIVAPDGIIYYTLDGTDPRRNRADGEVSSAALTYSGTVILNDNARVFARTRVGNTWSPPSIATYVVQRPPLIITEIMYHSLPPPPGNTNINEGDFDYFELKNVGATPLNLEGYTISGDVDFTFPSFVLPAGQRVLVVKNQGVFLTRYPGLDGSIAGEFARKLANEGNRFLLEGRLHEPILDFTFENQWHPITDGFGFSLVIVDENAPAHAWGLASNWRPSSVLNGTPGQEKGVPTDIPRVVVNEVLSNPEAPSEDAIELYNPTDVEVNVSGWWLTDDKGKPQKFHIPEGTFIPAYGFLALDEHTFNWDPGLPSSGFSFESDGDEVYLFAGDASGNLLSYMDGFAFGAADPGVTFGRHVDSVGQAHFVAQTETTMLASNSGPRVGPVVISEIMYHPPDIFSGGVLVDNTIDEYIELHNITDQPVPLYYANFTTTNAWLATNTWRLAGGVNFNFPTGLILAPYGFVLVVKFDPRREPGLLGSFRERYAVPANVPVLGPYNQPLSNTGDSPELQKPGRPAGDSVPYILVDRVDYSSDAPWPKEASYGLWLSLHRVDDGAYGNDPIHWRAAAPSAGSPVVAGGTPPGIIEQPGNITATLGQAVTFRASVAGTPPFLYQWRFNGLNLSGANGPSLTLPNLQARQVGYYSVIVINPAGLAQSSNALLSALFPLSIMRQPVSRSVYIRPDPRAANLPDGTNVTFTVFGDSGNSAVRYQWLFNGTNIPDATGASLTITNIQLKDEGDYSCAVSDSIKTIISVNARLVPWLQPIMVRPPVSQTIAEGSDFTASVEVTGHPAPFAYSWRRVLGNFVVATNSSNFRSNFITLNTTAAGLVLTHGMPSSNFTMRLVVYNDANRVPGVAVTFTNTVLADFDRDGIPDMVERSLGLDTNNLADAALDLDGDGMINGAEYIAGTDLTDRLSYLKVDRLSTAGAARIEFLAVSNRTYTVEATSELDGGVWTRIAEVVATATNHLVQVIDAMPITGNTQRVYRLVTPRMP